MAKLELVIVTIVSYFITIQIQAKPSSVQMPASCHGKNFCTQKPADYPESRFKNLLSDLNLRTIDDEKIGPRLGENANSRLCPSHDTFSKIYQIIDEKGDTRYVAQLENVFVQKLTMKECQKPGRVTDGAKIIVEEDLYLYNVSCVETKLKLPFLVLSHDGNTLELAKPMGGVPVTCSWKYSPLN